MPNGLKPKQLRAARLLAEDDLTYTRIADEIGVTTETLSKWRDKPEFKEEVQRQMEELEREMLRLPIAKKRHRVRVLDDIHRRLLMVVEDREQVYAQDPDVIGGRSGMVVKTIKAIGFGKNQQIVEEYTIDTGLVRELRATEEQAAKELGQWSDKGELNVTGTPLVITEIMVDRSGQPSLVDTDDQDDDDEED